MSKANPGFLRGEVEDLCGMRANPVSSLFLENCRVPEKNLLGKIGDGMKIGLATLDNGRIGVAAQALGIAQGAFEAAVKYAKERQQFKKPIASLQTIQNYIADMATEIAAARMLLYRACSLKDEACLLAVRRRWRNFIAVLSLPGYFFGRSDSRRLWIQQGIRC